MGPPYSIVCAGGHVLDDERAHEPSREIDGQQRCRESGCFEFIFGHCPHCGLAIPGYIDGPRPEVHGNIGTMRGHLSMGGSFPVREWREDCPFCKVPYPWASDDVLIGYQLRYLADLKAGSPSLPFVQRAADTYAQRQNALKRASKRDRRTSARRRIAMVWNWFDSTVKKTAALITALLVVGGAAAGIWKLTQDTTERVPTTTTTVTASNP